MNNVDEKRMELSRLIAAAKLGDWNAFAELVRRYQDLAFGYALSILRDFHLAEDAAQEAFVAAYFDLAKLQEPDAFPGWLRGIVRYQCYRILRKRHFELVPLDQAADLPAQSVGLEEQVVQQDVAGQVLEAIDALPQAQREVITLYYIREYSQQEVAAFLEVPVTTVNNRLHAARKQLKRRILPMVKDTLKEHALPDNFASRVGKLIEVRGPVVDAQFAPDQLPALLSALTITDEPRKVQLTVQVVQHLGNGVVRGIAVSPVEGLTQGMQVIDTGAPVQEAVDRETLGRAFNLLGNGRQAADASLPAEQAPAGEVLETGIKVIDLLCPYTKGGKVGVLGGAGVGKMVLIEEVVHNVASRETGVSLFTFVKPGNEVSLVQETIAEGYGIASGSVQTIVLSADDPLDPAPATALFDAVTFMSRERAESRLYPAVDPLRSTSRSLDPAVVGQEHYDVARGVRELLQRAKAIAERAPDRDELSAEDRLVVARARKIQRFLSQPFHVAEVFTGFPGVFVKLEDTIRSFAAIVSGEYDGLPEAAFYMVGTIEEAVKKADTMKAAA